MRPPKNYICDIREAIKSPKSSTPPPPPSEHLGQKCHVLKKKSTFKGQKHDFNSLPPLQRNLRFALPAICDFISSSWKWTFIWRNIFCVFHSCYLFLPTAAIFYANRGDEVTHTSEPMTAGMWGGSSPSSSSFFSSSSMFSSSSPPPVVGGNYSPHQHPSHRAMWSSCEKRKELLSFWFRLAACTAIIWITCADILTLELIRWLSCWKYNVSGSKENTCKVIFF